MATSKKQPTLASPDGKREWTPESAEEATNLRARGWTEKQAKPAAKTDAK